MSLSKSEALVGKGQLLVAQRDFAQAVKLLESRLSKLRKESGISAADLTSADKEGVKLLFSALTSLGISYYEMRQFDRARACFQEGIELSRGLIEEAARKRQRRREGKQEIQIDLSISKPLKPALWLSQFLHELSLIHQAEGDLSGAFALCQESVERAIGEKKEPAVPLQTLSILCQQLGRWELAAELLKIVREGCEARRDDAGLGMALHELGVLSCSQDRVSEGVAFLVEAIRVKRRCSNAQGMATSGDAIRTCLLLHPAAISDPEVQSILADNQEKHR
jgi:tetratricopeptide (TPR) repeat protein